MQVALVQCSPSLMDESQVFLNGINSSKRVMSTWKMTKGVFIQDLTELMKLLKKCGIWCIQIDV